MQRFELSRASGLPLKLCLSGADIWYDVIGSFYVETPESTAPVYIDEIMLRK